VNNKITHEQLAVAVTELLHAYGFSKVARFRPGLTQSGNWRTAVGADGKGYPDLTAAKPAEEKPIPREYTPNLTANQVLYVETKGRVIIAELKVGPDKLRPEQKEWLDTFRATHLCEVYVWTDKDYFNGTIEAALQAEGGVIQYKPTEEGRMPPVATRKIAGKRSKVSRVEEG